LPNTIHDAAYWQDRANEARARAENTHSPGIREEMLKIAVAYERLARRAKTTTEPKKGQ
jgi:hypothetical protein